MRLPDELFTNVALRHLNGMLDYYGLGGLYMFRKHLSFYIKGGPDASEFCGRLMTEESADTVKEGLSIFFRTRGD